jgi:pimeloyl-ACP methyl ester carboxylesterase
MDLEEAQSMAIKSDKHDYYITQNVDHFDRSNTNTFGQRYFMNTSYWTGPESNAPVFLCIGGEGPPLNWLVLVSSDHCNDMVELAPKHGALMLALEHRYYGPSMPNEGDFSNENLRFLSTEQALVDLAHFISTMKSEFKLTSSNKWVTFGGSYPGMLSALVRLRYPHLVHAAVSSSSPLQAQVDMPEYNEIVATSMASETVGGSQACADAVASGHASVGELLETYNGRRQLESMFNICGHNSLEIESNREQFAGSGVVYLPVQSNDPSCGYNYCNIERICGLMTDETVGSALDRLVALHKAQSGGSCFPVNSQLMLESMARPTNAGRSWYYQTCTEWGYYMTCPVGSKCLYVQGLHKLQSDYEMCSYAFGINSSTVDASISLANAMYGGMNLQGTRILYPNGEIDPWRGLGVNTPPNKQEPVLYVTGASHHFWTHASRPSDSASVQAARRVIWKQVLISHLSPPHF